MLIVTEFLAGLATKTTAFPDSEDLAGAAEALLRLQDTYALHTHQIASGDLMGVRDSPLMTGSSYDDSRSYRGNEICHKFRVISCLSTFRGNIYYDMKCVFDAFIYSFYLCT